MGTDNRQRGTDNRSKGTDNREKGARKRKRAPTVVMAALTTPHCLPRIFTRRSRHTRKERNSRCSQAWHWHGNGMAMAWHGKGMASWHGIMAMAWQWQWHGMASWQWHAPKCRQQRSSAASNQRGGGPGGQTGIVYRPLPRGSHGWRCTDHCAAQSTAAECGVERHWPGTGNGPAPAQHAAVLSG